MRRSATEKGYCSVTNINFALMSKRIPLIWLYLQNTTGLDPLI